MERYKTLRSVVGNSDPSAVGPNISEKVCRMVVAARHVYLNTFSFDPDLPLSSILKEVQIVSAFSEAKKPSDPQEKSIAKALRAAISVGYEKPADFAAAVVEYLCKKRELTSIVANLIFPELFGFFVFDQQASRGFEVVEELVSAVDVEFSKPFIRSFLTSAVEFADKFWEAFYDELEVNGRHKPSMMFLKSVIVAALNTSAKYLPPHHSQICITSILRDPRVFCECFFSNYLLESFESLKRTSRLTYDEVKKAFAYAISQPDFEGEVQNALTQQVFSYREEIINSSGKYVFLMSPYEIDILLDMLASYEPLKNMVRKVETSGELSVQPLLIGLSLFAGNENEMRILGNVEPVDVEDEEEIRDLIDQIYNAADELPNLIDPIELVVSSESKTETFSKKYFMKFFPKLDKDEVQRVLSVAYNDLVQRTYDWEDVLREGQLAADIDEIRKIYGAYAIRSESRIFAHVDPTKDIWPEAYARSRIKVDPNWFSLTKHRVAFEQVIAGVQCDHPKFESVITERDYLINELRRTVDGLSRENLGQRLYTLHRLLTSIATLSECSDDVNHYILCYLLSQCPENGFFETFVNLLQCENQQKDDFSLIPAAVQNTWISLRTFILSQISANEDLKKAIDAFALDPKKQAKPIATGSVTVMAFPPSSKK